MAFRIRRHNDVKNETVTATKNFANGEVAFRAAMGNAVKFITDHWDAAPGNGTPDGPQNNGRFKIYIERRVGQAEIELRYDYPIGDSTQETNSVYWRIVEI